MHACLRRCALDAAAEIEASAAHARSILANGDRDPIGAVPTGFSAEDWARLRTIWERQALTAERRAAHVRAEVERADAAAREAITSGRRPNAWVLWDRIVGRDKRPRGKNVTATLSLLHLRILAVDGAESPLGDPSVPGGRGRRAVDLAARDHYVLALVSAVQAWVDRWRSKGRPGSHRPSRESVRLGPDERVHILAVASMLCRDDDPGRTGGIPDRALREIEQAVGSRKGTTWERLKDSREKLSASDRREARSARRAVRARSVTDAAPWSRSWTLVIVGELLEQVTDRPGGVRTVEEIQRRAR